METYKIQFQPVASDLKLEKLTEKKYVLKGNLNTDKLNDIVMKIDYKGDRGMAFVNGLLVADRFYYGKPLGYLLKKIQSRA